MNARKHVDVSLNDGADSPSSHCVMLSLVGRSSRAIAAGNAGRVRFVVLGPLTAGLHGLRPIVSAGYVNHPPSDVHSDDAAIEVDPDMSLPAPLWLPLQRAAIVGLRKLEL